MQKIQSLVDVEAHMEEMEFHPQELTYWADELWQINTFDLEPDEQYFIRAWRLELGAYETLLFGRFKTDEEFKKDLEREPDKGYSTRMLDFVEEIPLEKPSRNPNSWTLQDVHGEIQTFIVCEKCRWINNMTNHRVEESGRVNPCVVCEGCKVHDFVWLKGWKLGVRKEKYDGRGWSSWWETDEPVGPKKKYSRKSVAEFPQVGGPVEPVQHAKPEPARVPTKVWDWVKNNFM
jgi:hypothetical protein